MQKFSENRRKINDFYAQTGKYHPDAYEFITDCVITQISNMPEARHLTAREVLDGVAERCRSEFGAVGFMVMQRWGVKSASDVGEIVFDLIGLQILSASEDDRRSDFNIDYRLFPEVRKVKNFSTMEIPQID